MRSAVRGAVSFVAAVGVVASWSMATEREARANGFEVPEIGTISNKAVAKLVGLAPIADDSGKRIGKRSVRGGRTPVRAILFVVAEVIRRHDPDFAEAHRKMNALGKPKKVIRVALARKLIVRLNAKARDVRCKLAKS